jgi:hypothetical protein
MSSPNLFLSSQSRNVPEFIFVKIQFLLKSAMARGWSFLLPAVKTATFPLPHCPHPASVNGYHIQFLV